MKREKLARDHLLEAGECHDPEQRVAWRKDGRFKARLLERPPGAHRGEAMSLTRADTTLKKDSELS